MTEPLTKDKAQVPVIAIGGIKGLGPEGRRACSHVATNVKEVLLDNC